MTWQGDNIAVCLQAPLQGVVLAQAVAVMDQLLRRQPVRPRMELPQLPHRLLPQGYGLPVPFWKHALKLMLHCWAENAA